MEYRKGRMTVEEKDYIEKNYQTLTVEDIATALKRRPIMIERYINENYGTSFVRRAKDAEYNIQSSVIWKDIERQFSKEELQLFLYHWGRVISQFKDDVFPTEQMQVIDTIKLDILMNRNLNMQQQGMQQILELQVELDAARDEDDRPKIQNLERQIAMIRASQDSMNSTYMDMSKKKDAILKEMKATRDARIKNIESSKESFGSWMKMIFSDSDMREKLGTYIEKMRIAADYEVKRLSEYTEYMDGTVDQPILNSETVFTDEDNK